MSESVRSSTTIRAPVADIMAVLADVETYPQWAKVVKSVNVLDRDAKGRPQTVEFEVTPGPLPKVRYVLRYVHTAGRIAWSLVEGDVVTDMTGAYTVAKADDMSTVTYDLTVDVSFPMPGFVKSRAAREITKVALEDLKRRVEGG